MRFWFGASRRAFKLVSARPFSKSNGGARAERLHSTAIPPQNSTAPRPQNSTALPTATARARICVEFGNYCRSQRDRTATTRGCLTHPRPRRGPERRRTTRVRRAVGRFAPDDAFASLAHVGATRGRASARRPWKREATRADRGNVRLRAPTVKRSPSDTAACSVARPSSADVSERCPRPEYQDFYATRPPLVP